MSWLGVSPRGEHFSSSINAYRSTYRSSINKTLTLTMEIKLTTLWIMNQTYDFVSYESNYNI